jgi:protein subunit release factor A
MQSMKHEGDFLITARYESPKTGWNTDRKSWVKVTHRLTGLSVECSSERTAHYNKMKALKDVEQLLANV